MITSFTKMKRCFHHPHTLLRILGIREPWILYQGITRWTDEVWAHNRHLLRALGDPIEVGSFKKVRSDGVKRMAAVWWKVVFGEKNVCLLFERLFLNKVLSVFKICTCLLFGEIWISWIMFAICVFEVPCFNMMLFHLLLENQWAPGHGVS